MNLPTASPKSFAIQAFQVISETLINGQVAAWMLESPGLKIFAVNRTTAISELEKVLKKCLESTKRMAIEFDSFACAKGDLADLNIDTLLSIPADDEYFRELMATFRANRELDDDNTAYTVSC
jgi:hypothetical protein